MTAEADVKDAPAVDAKGSNKSSNFDDKATIVIHELREENKNHRLKNKSVEADLELLKSESEARTKALQSEKEELVQKVQKYSAYEKRILESEVKTSLVIAGVKDPDLIKMIDMTGITISEDGTVDQLAVDAAVQKLKESKSFLFGNEKIVNTSSNAATKAKAADNDNGVLGLSDAEYSRRKNSFINNPTRG